MGATQGKKGGSKSRAAALDPDILLAFQGGMVDGVERYFEQQLAGAGGVLTPEHLSSTFDLPPRVADSFVRAMAAPGPPKTEKPSVSMEGFLTFFAQLRQSLPRAAAGAAFRVYTGSPTTAGTLTKDSFVPDFEKHYLDSYLRLCCGVASGAGEGDQWSRRIALGAFGAGEQAETLALAGFVEAAQRTHLLVRVVVSLGDYILRKMFLQTGPCEPMPVLEHMGPGRKETPVSTILTTAGAAMIAASVPVEWKKRWVLSYTSEEDGKSFNRFASHSLGKGPIVVVVRDGDGHVFGALVPESLRPHPDFFGNERSAVFSLAPVAVMYRSTGNNPNHVYYNAGMESLPNGFGMGGQLNYFGFFLEEGFEEGVSTAACTTFASPMLSKQRRFTISHVEVWVCCEASEGGGPGGATGPEGGILRSENNADKFVLDLMGKFDHSRGAEGR